ncbi:brain and acute leukemia cytoplasmic protein isoform X2 [Carassius auratus]|uniref:Brain and acute leukemia cytoplasmic protein isoform X2 n=1 Tax=Carassius auratus TaxID=7957 RepID=A0A6P6RH38_CARAU|nr:brain and acute leukemia cytoplasmic protein-like isoform X2 [Carassius auratus]XP_052439649.1 brain and acute leukemia cytoplasmic protein isoform X2 [Carassius gibelio]
MGCGGSRADAIEPRYHESWTRETESTWLTNTDAEIPNGVTSKNRVVRGESSHLIKDHSKLSGRGTMEARSCGDRGRQMVNAGTQCGKQVLTSSTCTKTSCSHEISDSKQTTHKEETNHTEGVSPNAASNPGDP